MPVVPEPCYSGFFHVPRVVPSVVNGIIIILMVHTVSNTGND